MYFVQERDHPRGPVKIGVTNGGRPALIRRLRDLQIGNPRALHAIAVMKGSYDEEAELHFRFWRKRLSGEWFEHHAALADLIRQYALRKPVTPSETLSKYDPVPVGPVKVKTPEPKRETKYDAIDRRLREHEGEIATAKSRIGSR